MACCLPDSFATLLVPLELCTAFLLEIDLPFTYDRLEPSMACFVKFIYCLLDQLGQSMFFCELV